MAEHPRANSPNRLQRAPQHSTFAPLSAPSTLDKPRHPALPTAVTANWATGARITWEENQDIELFIFVVILAGNSHLRLHTRKQWQPITQVHRARCRTRCE